jgi:hypothetical protein
VHVCVLGGEGRSIQQSSGVLSIREAHFLQKIREREKLLRRHLLCQDYKGTSHDVFPHKKKAWIASKKRGVNWPVKVSDIDGNLQFLHKFIFLKIIFMNSKFVD